MILQKGRLRVRGRLEYAFLARSEVVVIFGLLNEDGYAREQFGVADVVGMRVRNADEANVRRLYANRGKLRLERLRAGPMDVRRGIVGRKPAIWHGGDRIGDAGVPEKVILRMMDQEAAVRDVDRLSNVHANRPARLVRRVSLAAVKHIKTVHAFPARLRPARTGKGDCREGRNNDDDFFHGRPPSFNTKRVLVAQTSVCALFLWV